VHLPRALARFNRRFNNPLQLRWAGRLRGYGIVQHTGRKSGRAYRTPVNAFRTSDGFVFLVGYGTHSDWVRNLIAAGGGHLVHRGHRYALRDPRLLSGRDGVALLPAPMRLIARLFRSDDVLAVRAARA
jgi:deazaflavin-dependent oxidoreductase (nitroreductase family)